MSPGLQRAAIVVQRKHPLAKSETDQVEPLFVDFKGGIELVDAP